MTAKAMVAIREGSPPAPGAATIPGQVLPTKKPGSFPVDQASIGPRATPTYEYLRNFFFRGSASD
jgi:hypothetical protein